MVGNMLSIGSRKGSQGSKVMLGFLSFTLNVHTRKSHEHSLELQEKQRGFQDMEWGCRG